MQSRIMYGEEIVLPETPTREGFAFDGWYLDSEGTMAFDAETDMVTESMTLYAKWREK